MNLLQRWLLEWWLWLRLIISHFFMDSSRRERDNKIRKQIEYYFSDNHYNNAHFQSLRDSYNCMWLLFIIIHDLTYFSLDVEIKEFLTFPKMQELNATTEEIVNSLRFSFDVELSPDRKKARRRFEPMIIDKSIIERSSLYIVCLLLPSSRCQCAHISLLPLESSSDQRWYANDRILGEVVQRRTV